MNVVMLVVGLLLLLLIKIKRQLGIKVDDERSSGAGW